MKITGVIWITILILGVAETVVGDIVHTSAHGFSVADTVEVSTVPDDVYNAVIKNVDKWWHPDHTFSGDSSNLYIEAKPGGCFCEKLGSEGGVRHLTVVYLDPGKIIRMTGALGPLQDLGVTGSMTFRLKKAAKGTVLVFTYIVGGYSAGGLESWASPVDGVLRTQLQRLKNFVENGRP